MQRLTNPTDEKSLATFRPPFLKESVKRERSPSRSLRNGSALGGCLLFWLILLDCRCNCLFALVSVVVATGSCNRSFQGDCSQHIPSRGTVRRNGEQLCRRGRRGFI